MLALIPVSICHAQAPEGTQQVETALYLQTLDDFHEVEQTEARNPMAKLDEKYRKELETYQKTVQAAGNLKSVIAARQALSDLDVGIPPTVISADTKVSKLQRDYLVQRKIAETESETALAIIDKNYLLSLNNLVVKLTKNGQIDRAMEIQTKVDQLAGQKIEESVPVETDVTSQELQVWINRAKKEFPALSNPQSELSLKMKVLKASKASNPRYFSNPQWPYLLTKEANSSLANTRIPAAIVTASSNYPSNEFYQMIYTNGALYVGSRGGKCLCKFKLTQPTLHPKGTLVLVLMTKDDPYAGTPGDVLIRKGKGGPVVARVKGMRRTSTYRIPLDMDPSNAISLEVEVLHPDGLKLKQASEGIPDMFIEIKDK